MISTKVMHRWAAAIFVSVFLIKAIALFVVLPALTDSLSTKYGMSFADDYDRLAASLAQGEGYRFRTDLGETAMREPGYPMFLAGIFKIFGPLIEAARAANLFLAMLIGLMVAALARKVTGNLAIGIIAALIFWFHPGTLIAEARGGVEILFVFFLMLFMFSLYRALDRETFKDYFVAGLVLGCVVLIRSTPMLFPALLFLYLVFRADGGRHRFLVTQRIGIMVAGMAIVMAPWVVRNYALTQAFVPTATVQGVAAHTGQYICRNMSFDRGGQEIDMDGAEVRNNIAADLGVPFERGYYQYFYDAKDEVAFNKALMKHVIATYQQEPTLFVKCASMNLFNFWFAGKTWKVTGLNMIVQLPLLALAVVGGYLLWRRRNGEGVQILVLFVIYLYALHVAIHAQARYSIPLVPFLGILASVALVHLWQRIAHPPKDSK